MHDVRVPFKAPQLQKMRGFRFKQRELLTEFLNKRKSGILVAPTRYGKTRLIAETLRAFPNTCSVVTLPGTDLVKQMHEALKAMLPERQVTMLGAGSRAKYPSEDITVCSADSLEKCDTDRTELLLVDEPHAFVTDSREPKVRAFHKARILAYGATPEGRFDNRDVIIEGLFGPVLAERTYIEAVDEGAICPLVVLCLEVQLDWTQQGYNRAKTYDNYLFKSGRMAEITSSICHSIIPKEWQTLIFIKNENQADLFLKHVGEEGTIAMAKRMTPKERVEMFKRMQSAEIKRCLATEIYATGVTFSDIRAIINCGAGGDNTSAIQKPGRLAEIRPGKPYGVIFDFLFDMAGLDTTELSMFDKEDPPWRHVVRDSRSRMKAYTRKGYKVVVCKSIEELAEEFKKYV